MEMRSLTVAPELKGVGFLRMMRSVPLGGTKERDRGRPLRPDEPASWLVIEMVIELKGPFPLGNTRGALADYSELAAPVLVEKPRTGALLKPL
jgi:hypothetical protein